MPSVQNIERSLSGFSIYGTSFLSKRDTTNSEKPKNLSNVGRQNTSSFQTGSMKNLWKMTKTTTINNSCLFGTLSYQCSFTFHSAINCHCKPHTNPCDIKTDVSIKVENELCGVQFVTCSKDAFDFFTDLIGFII